VTTVKLHITLLAILVPAVAAGPAHADVALRHVAPVEAEPGQPLRLHALVDAGWEESLVVRYREAGATEVAEVPFQLSTTGEYVAEIPAAAVRSPGLDYWIVGTSAAGGEHERFASAGWPHRVRVEPDLEQLWIAAERRRLADRTSQVRASLSGQNFGSVAGVHDYYLRGEVDLTHRLVTTLYSINVGFGALQGSTPSSEAMTATAEERLVRYGYGGGRARLSSSIWLDGRVLMGFDQDGFIAGGGAELTLGRDWRSCVKAGFELAQGMGATLWVRLQWDTVPPLLMGATAIKTDLPDASRADGSAFVYDVSYAFAAGMRVTGALSFAARGRRPGGIGGTLGTSVDF